MVELGPNGMNLFLTVAFCTVLAIGIIAIPITALVLHHRRAAMKHRERMTMIEAGMHPDFPTVAAEAAPAQEMKTTLEYRPTA